MKQGNVVAVKQVDQRLCCNLCNMLKDRCRDLVSTHLLKYIRILRVTNTNIRACIDWRFVNQTWDALSKQSTKANLKPPTN